MAGNEIDPNADKSLVMTIVQNKTCGNEKCRKNKVIGDDEDYVKCENCHGFYHLVDCSDIKSVKSVKEFMRVPGDKMKFKFYCDFCNNENAVTVLKNEMVERFDELSSVVNAIRIKLEKMDNLNHKKFIDLTKVEQEIERISLNTADTNSKVKDNSDRTIEMEKKLDTVQFEAKKLNANALENQWITVAKKSKKKPDYAVVLKPNDNKSRLDITKALCAQVSPLEVKIDTTINATKEKLIVVCENQDEQQKMADIVRNKLNDVCSGSVPEKKNPRIKILQVEIMCKVEDLNHDLIIANLKRENGILNNATVLKIIKIIKAKKFGKELDNIVNILLEIDSDTYNFVMADGKVKYQFRALRVVDGILVGKCYKCLSFNHLGKDCQLNKACFKCGEDHIAKDCNSVIMSCINCKRANEQGAKYDLKHDANDLNCPCFLRKYSVVSRNFK